MSLDTPHHPLQAVLFDMDGTLVDTEEVWWLSVAHVAREQGHELTEADLPDVLGRPVRHTAAHLRGVLGTDVCEQQLADALQREFAARVARGVEPRPGAVRLLDELSRAGVPTALVTASPRSVADIVLRTLGIGHFTVTVTADDTEHSKPAPDPYLAAAYALGVRPSACVAVEDTPTGVASAEAAGCQVLAVPSAAPVPPAPGRTILDSLKQADLPLLRSLVTDSAAGPCFLTASLTTRNARVGEPFRASVAGLLRGASGSAPVTFAADDGVQWVEVSADGTLRGTPTTAGTTQVTVTAADGEGGRAQVTVRIPVVGANEPLVRELKVMSWNLWFGGTKVRDHRDKQLRVLLEADVDLVGLQETHAQPSVEGAPLPSTRELAEALGWDYHQAGENLGILSRYPIVARHGSPDPDFYGGTGVTVRLDSRANAPQDVVLWTAHLNYTPYGPYDACFEQLPVADLVEHEVSSGRLGQMQDILAAMAGQLTDRDTTPVLLVGDFNAPSHLDWTRATAPLHGGYGPVDWPVTKAAEDAGLRDSYRVAHPDPLREPGFTWSPVHDAHEDGSGRPEPQDRIDFVLYSGSRLDVRDATAYVNGSNALFPDVAGNDWPSDHAAVLTTFALHS
ncbi:HAD-IA family hydrolase [Streptomyces sp. RGM 3693]|uniref:HAD-IA family hydrolase n=1 Tax=Streptomyces sp. RGM 3693 TaxID=3413284 RepID=UPI003D283EEA